MLYVFFYQKPCGQPRHRALDHITYLLKTAGGHFVDLGWNETLGAAPCVNFCDLKSTQRAIRRLRNHRFIEGASTDFWTPLPFF